MRSVHQNSSHCLCNKNSLCDIDVTCEPRRLTGMHMREQWRFTVLVSGSSRRHWMNLYTLWLLDSKWLSKWNNESATNIVLSFNMPLQKLFRLFRRLQQWATGDWQLHHNAPAHVSHLVQSFFAKYQIAQVTQCCYSPDMSSCNFWLFPKPKSPLKVKRFQTINEILENMMGQLMAIGRTVWGPRVPTLKRMRPV